jgi:ribosomal-protein-alanine N-acetyltransferase
MNVVIETERLLLRNFTEDDGSLIYELNIDPDVAKYTHDNLRDPDHAKEMLEKTILPQYALYNHGRWAVLLKPGLEFIGWCGLKYRINVNEVDVGYRFKKHAWGKGYATEAAFASIRYGFEKPGLKRLVGRAEIGNIASWRVLENCGMQYIGQGEVDGFSVRIYEIFNPSVQ